MAKKIDNSNNMLDENDNEYEKNIYELNKKREAAVAEQRRQAEEQRKKREKQAEQERERKIAQERVELAKLKNGVISQEDTEDLQEVHEEAIELTFWQKVANIWYHDKVWICLGAFFLAVVIFISVSEITRKRPDLTIMMIADNGLQTRQSELEDFFEQYVDDIDGNGYVYVQILMMPLNPDSQDFEMQSTYNSKFLAQLQTCDNMLVITDSNTDEQFKEIMDTGLASDFPNNPYIDKLGFSMDMKLIAEQLKFEYMPNDVHLSIRRPIKTVASSLEESQESYDKTMVYFRKIVTDLTAKAIETRDTGLETEPVKRESSSVSETTQAESTESK